MSIGPYCQRIAETGLFFEFFKGISAEVSLVSKPSRVEPLIAPGLITNGLTIIHLLCANFNKTVIKIQKNQIIGHLNLNGIESVCEIYSFGNLTELGLPSDTNSVNLTLDTETLDKIPSEYRDTAIKLFRDYDDVFAQSNTNIGKYFGGAHKIDTGLHPPFKTQAII